MANKKTNQDQRMTFDRIREIEEQRRKDLEKQSKLEERSKEAAAKVELFKKQYEEALQRGVENDEDNTDELDRIDKELEEARKTAARRAKEADVARKHYRTNIDKDEVKKEFTEWKSEFYENEIMPELERIQDLKRQLTEAHLEYKDAINDYEREKSRVLSVIDPNGGRVFDFLGTVTPRTRQEVDKFFITAQTLEDLESGKIPNGVELNKNDKGGRK